MTRRGPCSHPTSGLCAGVLLLGTLACGGGDPAPTAVATGATLSLSVSGLLPLDPSLDGHYQAWVFDRAGTATSLGVVDARAATATFTNPVDAVASSIGSYKFGPRDVVSARP